MNTLLQFAQSSTNGTYTADPTVATPTLDPAAVVFVLFAALVIFAISYAISAVLLGLIFKKAGIASWIAWVPFYNSWKYFEIGGQSGIWSVLTYIPIVNIAAAVFAILAGYNIGLKLGQSGVFVLMNIFLPLIWLIWLAVDKSTWNDALGAPSKAIEHTGTTA